jgi:hypothetical protein
LEALRDFVLGTDSPIERLGEKHEPEREYRT